MATREQLLKDSTKVAQDAASMIGGTYEQAVGFKPITPEALTSSPTPMTITNPTTATEAPALAGLFQSNTDAFTKSLADRATATETAKNDSLTAFLDSLSKPGKTELTASAYAAQGGVDALQPELDALDQQLLEEQNSLRRRFEAIDKKGGGLQSGAQSEKDNLERVSLAKQADLAIIRLAKQGQFDSAKAIADRAVAVQLERDLAKQTALKTIYEDNKEQFTEAEQREFESKQADRDRVLQMQADKEMARFEQLIRQNDPLYKAQLRGEILANEAAEAKKKQIEEAIENGVVILDKDQQDIAMKLGKQFEDESKVFKTQVDAYNRVLASADDPSAAGDLSLIFGYMKMLDPNSVVRETEFATAQNAAGVPEVLRARYNQVLSGERLSPATRTDFVDRASSIYSSALDQQIDLEETYTKQGTNVYGLPQEAVDLIVRDIRSQGAVSDVAFGLTLNSLNDNQLAELVQEGLISTPSSNY